MKGEYLKRKYQEIEREEKDTFEIPEWHKEIVLQRLKEYHSNPEDVLDWVEVQKEIETKYGF